jgi:hypothetical protein
MTPTVIVAIVGIALEIIVGFAAVYGGFRYFTGKTEERLRALEATIDKYNGVRERLGKVEERAEFAHKRIDELRNELR